MSCRAGVLHGGYAEWSVHLRDLDRIREQTHEVRYATCLVLIGAWWMVMKDGVSWVMDWNAERKKESLHL